LLKEEQNRKLRQFIRKKGKTAPILCCLIPMEKKSPYPHFGERLFYCSSGRLSIRIPAFKIEALAEAYRKYKNKGFEIYQVSVDDNRIEWVDAIDQDKLTWTNVGDMEGSNRAVMLYNIQNIPYNYLLNEEGEIIAQNLSGPGSTGYYRNCSINYCRKIIIRISCQTKEKYILSLMYIWELRH
jgi:hypothetical protein